MSAEVEKVPVSIKKKKSNQPIYFGVDPTTGEVMSIDKVARGLACGCVCPACGTRLEARKGEIVRHHFAHETNQECLYGAELAAYRALTEYIRKEMVFFLPDAVLRFESHKKAEIIRPGYLQKLTDVQLNYDKTTYPPELVCSAGTNQFQIILDFEYYYSIGDYPKLSQSARDHNRAMVIVDIDAIEALASDEDLAEIVYTGTNKNWIYNRLVEEFDLKYRNAAQKPEKWGERYLCPAQKKQYQNVYSASLTECSQCNYCYDPKVDAFCLAFKRINHIDDFKKSADVRSKEFRDNNQLVPVKSISDYPCPRCGAPMKRRKGANGIFAGCSNYPECRGTRPVEPITEQVIFYDQKKQRK